MYFCGLFSGRDATNGVRVEYAVLDDIQGGIAFFHGWKNWLGAQREFQIKVLYKDPVRFVWGKPTIWVSNTDPRDGLSADDVEWLEGNCIFVHVTSPIFHANTNNSPE